MKNMDGTANATGSSASGGGRGVDGAYPVPDLV